MIKKIFPADITWALTESLQNPAASSCAEESLMRVLRKYDEKKKDTVLLEEIPHGAFFITRDGRVFRKGEQLRKRFRCTEKDTGLTYLISPVYEVKMVS